MSRIAVILPERYRGGVLRAARDVARMLHWAAQQRDERLDVAFSCVSGFHDPDRDFPELRDARIQVRPTVWRRIGRADAARHAAAAVGPAIAPLGHEQYLVPADGGANLLDCDFWLFITDRVGRPVLPLRPYGVMPFDYIQRIVPRIFPAGAWRLQARAGIPLVRDASIVLATTPIAAADVHAYAGVPRARIREVPLFFEPPTPAPPRWPFPYFVWVTNQSPHKDHRGTLAELEEYYERFGGALKTLVLGPATQYFAPGARHPNPLVEPYVREIRTRLQRSAALRDNTLILGEVSDTLYAAAVAGARFLLHSSFYDNGSFAVLDAAYLAVPSISSRYPAMEYFDRTCQLNLTFFDPYQAGDLARRLVELEGRADRVALPPRSVLDRFHWKSGADALFAAVKPWIRRPADARA